MAQRRNRRKSRTVSDHALLALHKYFLRAVHMHMQCSEAGKRLVAKYGVEALKVRTPTTERFEVEMYLDYWYAGLFAAVEGYEKLGLSAPEVENLRPDPLFTKLRAFRAGVYHFREKYFDDAIQNLIADPSSNHWMTNLEKALGEFLLGELARIKQLRPTDHASM